MRSLKKLGCEPINTATGKVTSKARIDVGLKKKRGGRGLIPLGLKDKLMDCHQDCHVLLRIIVAAAFPCPPSTQRLVFRRSVSLHHHHTSLFLWP